MFFRCVSANTRRTGAPSRDATSTHCLICWTDASRTDLSEVVKLFRTPVPLIPRPSSNARRFEVVDVFVRRYFRIPGKEVTGRIDTIKIILGAKIEQLHQ